MSAKTLHCSVCKGDFASKSSWLGHLITDSHLKLARQLLPNWDEKEKGCALVVFGKMPLLFGKDDKVVQYLSRDFGTFVTDFVWWAERPRVGFFQFESREKVKEVLGSLQNQQFRIEPDQLCQVREGGIIPELEWMGLYPENPTLLAVASPSTTTPKEEEEEQERPSEEPPPKRRKVVVEVDANTDPGGGQVSVEMENSSTSTLATESRPTLKDHLRSIQKLIEIPDDDYNTALDITYRLQEFLLGKAQKNPDGTSPDAVISRHWRLKLQYSPKLKDKNIPFGVLILRNTNSDNPRAADADVDMAELKLMDGKLINMGPRKNQKLTEGKRVKKKHFLSYEIVSTRHVQDPASGGYSTLRYCVVQPVSRIPFTVSILSDRRFVVEAQIWNLFQHLCTFDPHCFPVLSVVYRWARANSVTVGKTNGSHDDLPDPNGLNWLLMLYFQKEGLVPSPKLVLERPHTSRLFNGVNVGFDDSSEFPISWRSERQSEKREEPSDDQFAKEVLQHVYNFFHFCTEAFDTRGEQLGWILNTRDSEVIPKKEFLLSSGTSSDNWKLTEDELIIVNESIANGTPDRIIMLHPFFLNWRISASNAEQAIGAMRRSESKLKNYFKSEIDFETVHLKLMSLSLNEILNLLKVD